MTLTQTEKVDGTLGYGDPHPVALHGTGTVTGLPARGVHCGPWPGRAASRRSPRSRSCSARCPLYRVLRGGVSGADVKELEENLAALGYKGFTVDDDFTASTGDAVKHWQSDLGLSRPAPSTRPGRGGDRHRSGSPT